MAESLATLDRIASALAKAVDVDAVTDLRNKARAIEVYSRQQKTCKDIEHSATVVRLRAERRLGELLAKTVRAGNPQLSSRTTIKIPAGITRDQSARWQKIARLPEPEFEKHLASRNPSTKGLVHLADQHRRKRHNARGPASGQNVITGDMLVLRNRLEHGSVDLFLTDPPYADVESYRNLAELAATKLKDGGLCLAYTGKFHLPAIMQLMGKHLTYWWMFAVEFSSSHTAIHPCHIQSAWTPIIAFSKGKPDTPWTIDLLHGGGRTKGHHVWEQPLTEAEYLIDKLCPQGGLVVDPYTGSGTTLAAAKKLGRRYLGCELDASTARGARRRVSG